MTSLVALAPSPRHQEQLHLPRSMCGLRVSALSQIIEHAQSLSRAWGPVARGADFLWRELADRSTTTASIEARRRNAAEAQDAMASLQARAEAIAEELGTGWDTNVADAQRTARLLAHLDQRPDVPAEWLYGGALEALRAAAGAGRAASAAVHDARDDLTRLGCTKPANIDVGLRPDVERLMAEAASAGVPFSSTATCAELQSLASRLDADAATLEHLIELGNDLVLRLAAKPDDRSVSRLEKLAALGALVGQEDPPEAEWLNLGRVSELQLATSVLGPLASTALSQQGGISDILRPTVVELDLPALRTRFATVHKGLKKLGSGYRADKRALAAHTVGGKVDARVIARLDDAIKLQDTISQYSAAERDHSAILGNYYYHGLGSDFDRLGRAVAAARAAVVNSSDEIDQGPLARAVARQGAPDPGVPLSRERLQSALDDWKQSHANEHRYRLTNERPIREIADSLRAEAARCRSLGSILSTFDGQTGRPNELGPMLQIITAREHLDSGTAEFGTLSDNLAATLGKFFDGLDTQLGPSRRRCRLVPRNARPPRCRTEDAGRHGTYQHDPRSRRHYRAANGMVQDLQSVTFLVSPALFQRAIGGDGGSIQPSEPIPLTPSCVRR